MADPSYSDYLERSRATRNALHETASVFYQSILSGSSSHSPQKSRRNLLPVAEKDELVKSRRAKRVSSINSRFSKLEPIFKKTGQMKSSAKHITSEHSAEARFRNSDLPVILAYDSPTKKTKAGSFNSQSLLSSASPKYRLLKAYSVKSSSHRQKAPRPPPSVEYLIPAGLRDDKVSQVILKPVLSATREAKAWYTTKKSLM
jgi:Ulp1 family protease